MGKTAEYVCSGGPFGGTRVEVSDKCPLDKITKEQRVDLEYTDEAGLKWLVQYNVRVHDHNTQEVALIFIGQTPAE